MAANSATGGKRMACGGLSHRHSRLSPHQQPNGCLNVQARGCCVKKGAMLPALAGCWKRYPAERSWFALLLCISHFFSVFLVRLFAW